MANDNHKGHSVVRLKALITYSIVIIGLLACACIWMYWQGLSDHRKYAAMGEAIEQVKLAAARYEVDHGFPGTGIDEVIAAGYFDNPPVSPYTRDLIQRVLDASNSPVGCFSYFLMDVNGKPANDVVVGFCPRASVPEVFWGWFSRARDDNEPWQSAVEPDVPLNTAPAMDRILAYCGNTYVFLARGMTPDESLEYFKENLYDDTYEISVYDPRSQ